MSEIQHQIRKYCEYSRVFKGNSERTIQTYQFELVSFSNATGILSASEISRTLIEQYVVKRKLENAWSAKTIRNRLMTMRIFLDWCRKQDIITDNPAREIDLPRLPKRLPRHLSREQADKLMQWTQHYRYEYASERPRAVAIIALFLFAGLRRNELLNLKVEDVQLQAGRIFVRSGKGDKDRIIPINETLAEYLRTYLQERDRRKRQCPNFFVSLRRDHAMDERAIPRLVQKLRVASGVYFSPHVLRHTFATLMLEGGADIFAISKMMGHSDIKTTTIYLSATTAHLKSEISKHSLTI